MNHDLSAETARWCALMLGSMAAHRTAGARPEIVAKLFNSRKFELELAMGRYDQA